MLPGLLCSLTFTSNSCLEKSSQAEGIHVPVWVEGGKHCLAQRRWLPLGWAFSACREPFIQHTASKSRVSQLLMGGARLPGSRSLHRWGSQMIQTKEIRIMTSGDRWQTAAASCQAHKQHQHASWNKGSPVNLINWFSTHLHRKQLSLHSKPCWLPSSRSWSAPSGMTRTLVENLQFR